MRYPKSCLYVSGWYKAIFCEIPTSVKLFFVKSRLVLGLPRLVSNLFKGVHITGEVTVRKPIHLLNLNETTLPLNKGHNQINLLLLYHSQFHTEFSRHVPISSEHFPNRNNLTNQKTSRRCDLYLNKHFRYPMITS